MSRTTYYYDSPESLNLVAEPGELCDACGQLSRISPAGSMIPMPCDAALEEYGHREGNVHMHPECADNIVTEYRQLVEAAEYAIQTWRAEKGRHSVPSTP